MSVSSDKYIIGSTYECTAPGHIRTCLYWKNIIPNGFFRYRIHQFGLEHVSHHDDSPFSREIAQDQAGAKPSIESMAISTAWFEKWPGTRSAPRHLANQCWQQKINRGEGVWIWLGAMLSICISLKRIDVTDTKYIWCYVTEGDVRSFRRLAFGA